MERESVLKEAWLSYLQGALHCKPTLCSLHYPRATVNKSLVVSKAKLVGYLVPSVHDPLQSEGAFVSLGPSLLLFCDPERIYSLWLDDLLPDNELCRTGKGSLPFPRCPHPQQEKSGIPLDLGQKKKRSLQGCWMMACHYKRSGSDGHCL